ncbi:zinc ribbon domain-containing protein [Blastopirellula marina]|uniref:Zinc ribbon domain-containing protein n=1 Tax=Blastopirellula marina TaxID=124 RepID=A0A2S8F5H9_9BACT|nr:zinc ribbon domain-containing protein [Blastopirellula marina]PQO27184.1 hypothetical protein C5Y98_28480 [Blastopirellula marina]PTL41331.1 hypothetical protein C5Y97_28495 [Blastopirellula marina]
MKLIPLNCRQCGAPLSVPEEVRHVTCLHCGTQLAVVREGAAAYTEILEQLERRTSKIEQQFVDLRLQRQLDALEKDWAIEQKAFLGTDSDGEKFLPDKGPSIASGVAAAVVALVGMMFFLTIDDSSGLAQFHGTGFALLIGGVGVVRSWLLYRKRVAYDEAEERYLLRRAELTEEG